MAVTQTLTANDIIKAALRKAGIVGIGETPSADDVADFLVELNLMLKGWQNEGFGVWTKTSGTHTLTTGAAQTLDPVRPLRILSARFKRPSGVELPMVALTRDEYDMLPDKGVTGTPTQFYYDRQREAARLYVWPTLATAAGEVIEYTYEREVEDLTNVNSVIDVPAEWYEAVYYNLAARALETVPVSRAGQAIIMRAEALLDRALAFDGEASVFWTEEGAA